MNILLQTRCGCMRGAEIQASVPPGRIVMDLPDNSDLSLNDQEASPKSKRIFSFIGTSGPDERPTYLESMDVPGYAVPETIVVRKENDKIEESR